MTRPRAPWELSRLNAHPFNAAAAFAATAALVVRAAR